MKQENHIVKFRNRFTPINMQTVSIQNSILKDSLSTVTNDQLNSLIQLYTRDAFLNGFNPSLAYRIIILYCYSSNQQTKKINNFQLTNQLNRFLNHQLNDQKIQNIQQCLDLLIFDEVRRKLPQIYQKWFKIKILSTLNKYYYNHKKTKDRKMSTYTLRQLCKQTLKNQKIKHNEQIYCQILDISLQLQDRQMKIILTKNKRFQALQFVNNMIKYLQNTDYSLKSSKYQQKLLYCYWYCAILHFQLHYIVYTKKYLNIVINIARRQLQMYQNNLNINRENNKQEKNNQIQIIKRLAEDLLQKVTI